MTERRPGLIMCVALASALVREDGHLGLHRPGAHRAAGGVRNDHPQLCEEDGTGFWPISSRPSGHWSLPRCAPNMQNKLFRDAFAAEGIDVKKDMVPLDIREIDHRRGVREGGRALREMGMSNDSGHEDGEGWLEHLHRRAADKIAWAPTIDYDTVRLLHGVRRLLPAPVFDGAKATRSWSSPTPTTA